MVLLYNLLLFTATTVSPGKIQLGLQLGLATTGRPGSAVLLDLSNQYMLINR